MILNILMHKNMKINCFTNPIFIDIEPEKVAIQESRSLQVSNKVEEILPYKNLKLYFVGIFNDETGEIILKDENGDTLLRELLDCRKIVSTRLNEIAPKKEDDA